MMIVGPEFAHHCVFVNIFSRYKPYEEHSLCIVVEQGRAENPELSNKTRLEFVTLSI